MCRHRTLTLLAASAVLACALVPSSALAISRETAIARGKVWLNAVRVDPVTKKVSTGVPYSQGKWALENGSVPPTSTPTAGYRTDCSGFASLCWDLHNSSGKPYSTSTYEMGKNNSPYFKLTAVKQSELLPGDLMLKSTVWYTGSGGGHAIIFAGWSKSDMSEYWALEQTGPGTKYSRRPWGQSGYRAFRYNGIEGFNRTRVTYGSTFTITGTAYGTPNATGSVVATGGAVDLALYDSDGTVNYVASNVPVSANGQYSITYAPTRTGRFAVLYRSFGIAKQSSVLPATTVTVAPYVAGVGRNGSVLRRGRTYVFSGCVNPRVGTTLRVYKYNTKKHAYLLSKTANASISSRKSSSGYSMSARWRPTASGKYRLSWATGVPAGMTSSVSGYRYITVK
jgi:hypothetical protein